MWQQEEHPARRSPAMPISMANHVAAPRRDPSAPPSYRAAAPSYRTSRPPLHQSNIGAATPSYRATPPSQRYQPRRRDSAAVSNRRDIAEAPKEYTSSSSPAQAIFYDDNPDNFRGISIRGKYPSIRPVHCLEPVTCAQLQQAIGLVVSAASDPPNSRPTLFFFFPKSPAFSPF